MVVHGRADHDDVRRSEFIDQFVGDGKVLALFGRKFRRVAIGGRPVIGDVGKWRSGEIALDNGAGRMFRLPVPDEVRRQFA